MTSPSILENFVRAFIDTDVIMAFAEGTPDAVELFSAPVLARAHYLINPIVVQELILSESLGRHPGLLSKVQKLEMVPLEMIDTRRLLAKSRPLRNRGLHVNEFLIFASAEDCDFLVTYDDKFKILRHDRGPAIVTPREFVRTITD